MSRVTAVLVLIAVATVVADHPVSAEDTPGSPGAKTVTERLDTLEKTVLKDPFHPKDTVLARLDALEAVMKKTAKANEQAGKVEGQADEQIKRSIEGLQKDVADMAKRLKALENAKPTADARDHTGEIKDLKRLVEQTSRSLDDLKARLARLEAKR